MAVKTATNGRRFRRRVLAFVASFAALSAVVVLPAGAELSTTPDPTWGVLGPNNASGVPTNPRVYAMLRVGDLIYLGGSFAKAVPPAGTPGASVPRANLAAINATTGEIDLIWDPVTDGPVHTLALSTDGTTIFAGGNFNNVDGIPRKNLVALDVLTGEVDPTWNVSSNFPVWSAVATGTKLYIGGNFTNLTVNGVTTTWRSRLAALDQNTGAVDKNWKPSASARVKALELSPDRTWLYVGGDFKPGTDSTTGQPTPSIAGGVRYYVAALETATGNLVQSFESKKRDMGDPNVTGDEGPYTGFWDVGACGNGCVIDLVATPTVVYIGMGGITGNKVMAVDAVTGAFKFERYGDGDVQALALRGNQLFVGGHFEAFGGRKKCSDPALVDPTKCRDRFAVLNATTNAIEDYYVKVDSNMGIWAILAETSRLYLAGDFKKVQGVSQPGFVQFTDVPVVPTPTPTADPSASPTADPSATPTTDPSATPTP